MNSIDFSKLFNERASLNFWSGEPNQFKLGSIVFEVLEDEEDGYRSSMKEVSILKNSVPVKEGEFLATVTIVASLNSDVKGYSLVDDQGHVWLTFGTDESADYYPCFHFYYSPAISIDSIKQRIK